MKKLFLFLCVSLLSLASVGAQTQPAPAAKPQRLVGEVTAVDAAAKTVTVRADTGETVTLSTTEQTTYTRLPPGETALDKGARVTLAEVSVGDRVLAPGVSAAGGTAARLILMARAAGAGPARDEGRRLNGRVVSVDAAKKLIVVQPRGGREGQESVTVDASAAARFQRYAPDSMRPADAVAASLADVRVGDNIRATGARAADGATFKAEEILAGSFSRLVGTVAAVDAQRNELSVRMDDGQNVKLSFGARSSMRRITPEFEQALAQQRAEFEQRRQQRRAERQQQGGQAQGEGEGRRAGGRGRQGGQRGDGEGRGEAGGPRRGGNNFQQMLESQPAVALADLKKGDAVVVTVTPGADASRATVVSLLTGAPETIRAMQQFQRGGDGPRGPNSPGLPGDVIGGGQGPTREPPR